MGDFVTGDIVTISDKHCRLNPSLRRSSISRILFLFPSLPLSPFPSASERYGSFLTYFPFRPSVRLSVPDPHPTFLPSLCRSFVRSFISSGSPFTISLFMLRNQRRRRGGRIAGNAMVGQNVEPFQVSASLGASIYEVRSETKGTISADV